MLRKVWRAESLSTEPPLSTSASNGGSVRSGIAAARSWSDDGIAPSSVLTLRLRVGPGQDRCGGAEAVRRPG